MTDLGDRLAESVTARTAMIERFGFVPVSVLRLHRGARSKRLFNLPNERASGIRGSDSSARIATKKSDEGRARAEERRAAGIFGGVQEAAAAQGREVGSVMAAELVDFVCAYYCPTPDSVYLDPFAGHGVRAQVAWSRGLRYYAMDASAAYVEYVEAVAERLGADVTMLFIERGDSRDPSSIPDGCGDFSFTSPPYWDTEYYGPEPEQLGTVGVPYDEFIAGMTDVYRAWLPKFKSGAFVVLNVNDIRRDRRFYSYHADLIVALSSLGYELHDTWIIEGLVAQLPRAFAVSFNNKGIAPKVHEYLLVFRVP